MSTNRDGRSVSLEQREQGEAEETEGGQLIRASQDNMWRMRAAGHVIRCNVILHCRGAWMADSRHIRLF